MTKQLGFIVNSERCIGCHSCEMACKNFNRLDPDIRWRKVYPLKEDVFGAPSRIFMSLACNHCDNPQCLKVCPVKAYSKREDGIVMQDRERCIGCRMCVMACPYSVPQYNKLHRKVEKCHLCFSRLDKGQNPACVDGCPLGALDVTDLNNYDQTGTVSEFPAFPDPKISRPAVRFIKPRVPVQIRRDK